MERLKNGYRFKDNYGEYIYKKNDLEELDLYKINEFEYEEIPDYSFFADKDNDFILIEENQNIDIQNIEKLQANDWEIHKMHTKINEMLGAIKQLDRQINNN